MSEPQIGEVRPTNEGRRMWLGDGWYYVGSSQAEHRLSTLLTEAEQLREVLQHLRWCETSTIRRCAWCMCLEAENCSCRLARLIERKP